MTEPAVPLSGVARTLRDAGLLFDPSEGGPRLPELSLAGVTQDSREVAPGDLFLAWKGERFDAHDFVAEAARRGAAAAVVERRVTGVEIPQLLVRDGRRAAALAAHEVLGRPSERLRVTAVTGTNGKTTVVWILRQLLSQTRSAGSLGTLGAIDAGGRVIPGSDRLTTPGPVEVSRRLRELADIGVTEVILEASSHALEQRRLDGIRIRIACFTNLSQDHLDYHPSMEAYLGAKARLLSLLALDGGAVVNALDPAWAGLPRIPGALLAVRAETDGESGPRPSLPEAARRLADLLARDIRLEADGTRFTVSRGDETVQVHTSLLGAFNVENSLVALGAALLAGLTLDAAAEGLSRVSAPPGRLEVVAREPVPVLVDYAHTPDALARVLETLRPLCAGRLIVVFGAGGDRDRSKRAAMGRVAAAGADLPIVTSDNPRTEEPGAIVDEIIAGMGSTPHLRVVDRREAIRRALELARTGDMVLLAGKGHEQYQVIGTERTAFDEREIVRGILAATGNGT